MTSSQTSKISLKTLKGVFELPNMNHRRDFLRENKLNLRELQKTTTHKLIQQKQEIEKVQNKYLPKFQKSQDEIQLGRRSASQKRTVEPNDGRESRTRAGRNNVLAGGGGRGEGAVRVRPNYLDSRRAYSQQRQSMDNVQNCSSCCCHNKSQQKNQNRETQYSQRMPRSSSAVSVLSKAESCDKEIQTEDIYDEDFLYNALRKCSYPEDKQLNKEKSNEQLRDRENNINLEYFDQEEIKSLHSQEQIYKDRHNEDNKFHPHQHEMQQFSTRDHNTDMQNGHHHNERQEDVMYNGHDEDLEQNFQNLRFNDKTDLQTSARSRQTIFSTSSRRNPHKLGSRDDIRLPRYLEKEKREKKEEHMRSLSKDPNCPIGHYAMDEEERLKVLHKAQQKMTSLINELNHMPMTTETLRIRQRKAEIERELTQLELDIRIYSKTKVYVPETTLD